MNKIFTNCCKVLAILALLQASCGTSSTNQDSAPSTDTGILYGFWGLNGYHTAAGLADVTNRFAATVFQVAAGSTSYTVNTFLPLVRASGMKVTLRLSGAHAFTTSSGDFDLAAWKSSIATWSGSGIQEFIDDGTVVGHMLLDDITNYTGTDPTAADLDEMARYSKEIMPGLMTFVRQKASAMPVPTGGTYVYVDAVVNQYKASDGDVTDYAQAEHDAAIALGVGIINGMNICDGGDGSSGQIGWSSGKYAMSATEITTYGTALLSVPDVMMFLMWEFDGEETWSDDATIGSDYFDQTELEEALYDLGVLAEAYDPT